MSLLCVSTRYCSISSLVAFSFPDFSPSRNDDVDLNDSIWRLCACYLHLFVYSLSSQFRQYGLVCIIVHLKFVAKPFLGSPSSTPYCSCSIAVIELIFISSFSCFHFFSFVAIKLIFISTLHCKVVSNVFLIFIQLFPFFLICGHLTSSSLPGVDHLVPECSWLASAPLLKCHPEYDHLHHLCRSLQHCGGTSGCILPASHEALLMFFLKLLLWLFLVDLQAANILANIPTLGYQNVTQ